MPKQPENIEIFDDMGPVELHPEVFKKSDSVLGQREDARLSLRAMWQEQKDRLTLDFIRHPKRDGIAAAITLGGLGLAVGAALPAKRR